MKVMKILLIYPPFCTPASPSYSITNLFSFLKNNLPDKHKTDVIDLNISFHRKKFPDYWEYCKSLSKNYDFEKYEKTAENYRRETHEIYSENNKKVLSGSKPELFYELLDEILEKKPDIAAFSIVFSSQAFYAYALIEELKKNGIKTIVGGPSVSEMLKNAADKSLKNEIELLEYISGKKCDYESLKCETVLDFSAYRLSDYFTPKPMIPIKTSNTCYYKQCTFCTHHEKIDYREFSLKNIKKTIIKSKQKNFLFIDDMIHTKRLLEISKMLKPLKVSWMCQLRPTKDFDLKTLKIMYDSGLKIIYWGIESASDRILGLIGKGTNKKSISKVLKDSHDAGIKNGAYIMFGFPTETKEEFIETIDFLKNNSANIDIVSTAIFGLQKGSKIYENPSKFGISEIIEEKRTVLDPKISYKSSEGITQEEANMLRKKFKKSIENINKYPKMMNFFREHMISVI